MRIGFALAMVFLLGACSLFSTPKTWMKSGTTMDQTEADLDACKDLAREQVGPDESIDQDIATANEIGGDAGNSELSQNMSNQRSGERYDDIIESCMRGLGYVPAR